MTKQHTFTVAVDFDGTIHNHEDREPGYRMGKPFPGARESLIELRQLGAKIIIHTCRARAPQGEPDPQPELAHFYGSAQHVADWLTYFDIPFDDVTALKPMADAYVDDKAVAFTGDWDDTHRELLSLYYMGVEP